MNSFKYHDDDSTTDETTPSFVFYPYFNSTIINSSQILIRFAYQPGYTFILYKFKLAIFVLDVAYF
jgi:hypothetical protein